MQKNSFEIIVTSFSSHEAENKFVIVNPVTQKTIGELPECSREMVERRVLIAKKEFPYWSKISLKERSQILTRFRKILVQRREEIVSTICEETGKTRKEITTCCPT